MKARVKGIGAATLAVVTVGSYYWLLLPKIGHANKAEITAALPASLKVEDRPDPAGEARYGRLCDLAQGIDETELQPSTGPLRSLPSNEAVLREVERLLDEGTLRVPKTSGNSFFPELPGLKNVAKIAAYATQAAWRRGDRKACGHWAVLGFRYSTALRDAGGVIMDQLVAVAIDAIAHRAAYRAEIENGLDSPARERLLALLPSSDSSSKAMADAVRRDFQSFLIPTLLAPEMHNRDFAATPEESDQIAKEGAVGTLDPVATARMGGEMYDALISNLLRPFWQANHAVPSLVAEAQKNLPAYPPMEDQEATSAFERWKDGFRYRIAMNSGRNTLGRRLVSSNVLGQLGDVAVRDAANRNILRKIILLRMGRNETVPDPYAKGELKTDRKRRIVWSVGKDGQDAGGKIGQGGQLEAPDYGYPYGDHSWSPPLPRFPWKATPARE